MDWLRHIILLGMMFCLSAAPAQAQFSLPMGGGLGNGLGLPEQRLPDGGLPDPFGTLDPVGGGLADDARDDTHAVRRDLVGRPVRADMLDRAPSGAAIVKDRILAVSPGAQSLAIIHRLQFTVVAQDRLAALGLVSVTLKVPDGLTEASALATLRAADPAGAYDYDHIYNPGGEASAAPSAAAPVADEGRPEKLSIGMIDGGLETRHPCLVGQTILTRAFAGDGKPVATAHGTAVGSLLVGRDGAFAGYLPGARLYAADVYGGSADGGSAADIASALNWLAGNQVPVTNISLAGPDNALLAVAVKAFVGRGHVLVAAAGNDGPAAPPNYPAAYPGVIGVTSVDAAGHLEVDANRNAARFAARGVDIPAAALPRGYANVTGTSYAAPAVTAQLDLLVSKSRDAGALQTAVTQLSHQAVSLPDSGLLLIAAPRAVLDR